MTAHQDLPAGTGSRPWRAITAYRDRRRDAEHLPIDAFQISTALLLLTLVVAPPEHLPTVARLWFAVGLLVPFLARRYATFWILGFALFLVSPLQRPWLTLDNHEILQVYWLGAVALSQFAQRPDEVLRRVARWAILLVFLFATAWKLLSPDFADGSALAFLVGVEPRMAEVAVALSIQDEQVDELNRARIRDWWESAGTPSGFRADVADQVRRWAPMLAWTTIAIEALVAVVFLAPLPPARRWLRDAALLGFVLLTYPLTPVLVFAWLLLSLGAMQSDLEPAVRNRLYVGLFLVVTFVYGLRHLTLFPLLRALSGG